MIVKYPKLTLTSFFHFQNVFIILQIKNLIGSLKSQLQAKSEELNCFKEQHNIRSHGEKPQTAQQKEEKASGVLVSQTEK
jgi:hypothetical protein